MAETNLADLGARLMPQGRRLSDLLMTESLLPAQPTPVDPVTIAELGGNPWRGVVTPIRQDTSLSPVPMALGLIGGPSLAMFAGPMAKTANKAALAVAQRLAGEGAGREQIWKETGWFQGVDKKWRFEIPDNAAAFPSEVAAKFEKAPVGEQFFMHNADRVMPHPELHAAYPDMWSVNTRLIKGGGYPYQASGVFETRESGKQAIGLNAANLPEMRSLNLHELQHAIQKREGFAAGTSPQVTMRGYRSIVNDATAQIEAINQQLKSAAGTPRYNELLAMRQELVNEIQRIEGPHGIGVRERGHDEYRRHAGEVEARNVQTRRDMTPAERAERPPWTTQDVPNEQQIVNFDSSVAAQWSAAKARLAISNRQREKSKAQ